MGPQSLAAASAGPDCGCGKGPTPLGDVKILQNLITGDCEKPTIHISAWMDFDYTYRSTGHGINNIAPVMNRFGDEFLARELGLYVFRPLDETASKEFMYHWQVEEMGYDLLHSFRNQPVFNSENHPIPNATGQYEYPMRHTRAVMWQGGLHHMGASTTWVWEQAKEDSLRSRQQELESSATKRQNELMAPIMETVRKVLEDIRVEDGYAMIFSSEPGSSQILAADKNLDITERVVARLRTVAAAKPAPAKPVRARASRAGRGLRRGRARGPPRRRACHRGHRCRAETGCRRPARPTP